VKRRQAGRQADPREVRQEGEQVQAGIPGGNEAGTVADEQVLFGRKRVRVVA